MTATKIASTSLNRWPHKGGKGGRGVRLAYDHAAVVENRTLFPNRVSAPLDREPVLKSGHNNTKIGRIVQKGRYKGFPIFTLTLEERATCPRSCDFFASCYGNRMQWPTRWKAGTELEDHLDYELHALAEDYPQGFLVRLHVLGDFYSVEYVRKWHSWLEEIPQLHIFGFTARIDPDCPITQAIALILRRHPERFSMRFSNADMSRHATESIEIPENCSQRAIVCPQQLNLTQCCATCALCWHTNKNIAFLRH